MRSPAFIALGLGFIGMGAGLYALTLRKPSKPAPAQPTARQQRELAELAEEVRKMRLGAGITAGFGVALVIFALSLR